MQGLGCWVEALASMLASTQEKAPGGNQLINAEGSVGWRHLHQCWLLHKSKPQAGEFSSRIQQLASRGSAANQDLVGSKFWMS
uniref:Uncharacterized protein n=1 Tax=Nelumbo nucifera TaxID=4432 RepID=A0A822Z1M1_NELNU|nr:TPA_asm: hypothetical protein HUJ06_008019 [Nelumbo nucifera]